MCDKTHYNKNVFLIELYKNGNGEVPFINFMNKIDYKMQSKIYKSINKLKNSENLIKGFDTKKLDSNLFELRVKQGNSISRILYFFYYKNTIVITNAFIKKSKKTPKNEIQRAIKYQNDWLRRHNNETL